MVSAACTGDHVLFPGFVSDDQLSWLYQNATVFAFPPLSEGSGLLGLAAMANRLPVASSNASCLPEVYGDAAMYFDPTKVESLVDSIVQVLEDPDLRGRLVKAGEARAGQFSWRRMAEQTLDCYRRATHGVPSEHRGPMADTRPEERHLADDVAHGHLRDPGEWTAPVAPSRLGPDEPEPRQQGQ